MRWHRSYVDIYQWADKSRYWNRSWYQWCLRRRSGLVYRRDLLELEKRIMSAIEDLNSSVSKLSTSVTAVQGAVNSLLAIQQTNNDPAITIAATMVSAAADTLTQVAASIMAALPPAPPETPNG